MKTKKCTKCLTMLSVDRFYSKGNRTDSICKDCAKSKKRSKYVSRNIELNYDRLKTIIDVVSSIEKKLIVAEIKKLDEVIERCQKKLTMP